jgi:RNA polymerase sigma-70 factor (ECF subfamily)
MKQVARGNLDAFSDVIDRYRDSIYRVSYLILHDSATAEDVTQETFTRGLEGVKTYRAQGDPRSWFYAIAINLCRSNIRARKRQAQRAATKVLETGRRPRATSRGILTSLVRRETGMSLAISLGHLTDMQRKTFVLHYVEDLPYREVSGILGISADAARALSYRAREILREKLGPDLLP